MNEDNINDYVTLKSLDGSDLNLSDDGVIITEKMAEVIRC